jgi:hypothetical protein
MENGPALLAVSIDNTTATGNTIGIDAEQEQRKYSLAGP